MEKISIIVPVYNVEKYLEKCVKSLINQTHKNLEIILVDDASTDKSGNLCEKIAKKDKRIKVIHNKTNKGLAGARNVGIKNASGDYVGFIDSDDYIENDMYEILMKNLKEYNAEISACRGREVLEDGTIISEITDNNIVFYKKEEILEKFLERNKISVGVCDKLFKKKLISNLEFNEKIRNSEDKLFSYEALKRTRKYVQQNISKYNYLMRGESLSHTANIENYCKIIDISKYIYEDIEKKGTLMQKQYAFLNVQLTILDVCRNLAEENKIKKEKKKYKELINELKKGKINYSLIKNNRRKLELIILRNISFLYYFLIKIYNWRKRKI